MQIFLCIQWTFIIGLEIQENLLGLTKMQSNFFFSYAPSSRCAHTILLKRLSFKKISREFPNKENFFFFENAI